MIFIPVKAPVPIHQALTANRIRTTQKITQLIVQQAAQRTATEPGTTTNPAATEVTVTAVIISEATVTAMETITVTEVTAITATVTETTAIMKAAIVTEAAMQMIPARNIRKRNQVVSSKKRLSVSAWDCSSDCLQESASTVYSM